MTCITYNEWTPLMNAAAHGDSRRVFEIVRDQGVEDVDDVLEGLWLACQFGQCDCVLSIKEGCEHPKNGGDPEMDFRKLINLTDRDGWSALNWAAGYNHPDLVALLLESGVNPNTTSRFGGSPIELAKNHGYIEVVNIIESYVPPEILKEHTELIDLHSLGEPAHRVRL